MATDNEAQATDEREHLCLLPRHYRCPGLGMDYLERCRIFVHAPLQKVEVILGLYWPRNL